MRKLAMVKAVTNNDLARILFTHASNGKWEHLIPSQKIHYVELAEKVIAQMKEEGML